MFVCQFVSLSNHDLIGTIFKGHGKGKEKLI